MDVYIDRTSVEVFIDDGLYSFAAPLPFSLGEGALSFWGSDISVTDLRLGAVGSIWH